MSVVFINDHPFSVDKDGAVFTSGTLDSKVWSRFTDNFGDLTVVGRGSVLVDKIHAHKRADAMNVKFDLFMNVKGGYDYFKYKKQIEAKLITYIRESDFIVLRLPSSLGVIASNLCMKLGKKYLVEVVGCPFDSLWYYGGGLSKIIAPINARRNRKAIYRASAVVYVTTNYLQEKYPNPNSQTNASNVVIENFENSVLEKHVRFLRRETTCRNFGMIGNIELPYKGYEYLFKALKEVHQPFQLHIVGGGDPDWINSLIKKYNLKDKVVLRGRINNRDEIFHFLDSLDIYLQPSLTEGLPRGVIEAMARGCPVIGSNVGGIPELIETDKIYKPKDYERLSCLISTHMNNQTELERMSSINFKKSKEYSLERIKLRRYKFFREIKDKIKN